MTTEASLAMAIVSLAAFAAGTIAGFVYFYLLERNLAFYLDGSPLAGAALQVGRFLLAAAVLYAAVQFGAVSLLACALGFLAGRHVVLRRCREAE